jgi:hypothetical protein
MKLSRITTATAVAAALVAVTLYAPMVFGYQAGAFIMRATMNEGLYLMMEAIAADKGKASASAIHNDRAAAALARLKGLAAEWQSNSITNTNPKGE